MEGLEISEVSLVDVMEESDSGRFDSEFFQNKYRNASRKLLSVTIDSISVVAHEIIHPTEVVRVYQESGIQILLAQNVRDNKLEFVDKAFMNPALKQRLLKNLIEFDDIIVTRSGANYGQTACFKDDFEIYACADVLILKTNNRKISGGYLSTFLNTSLGKLLVERGGYGAAQPHISPTYLNRLPIPRFKYLEQKIDDLVLQSIQTQQRDKALYQEAEALLLAELGLADWQPTTKTTEVKSLADSFGSSGRLDAEYYQPRFDELESKLRATGKAVYLGSLLTFCQRGTQPVYVDDAGLVVINSKHVRANRIDSSDNRVAVESQTRSDLVIRKGDVLINGTGVGTIGRSAAYLLNTKALPDNHVTILRSKSIDPVFLALQQNSIIGRLQVDKYFKGSSGQIELYPDDINQFLIWQAPEDVQASIRNCIEMGQKLSTQSAQLLSRAKHAVEMAIETSEDIAMVWLNEQTK